MVKEKFSGWDPGRLGRAQEAKRFDRLTALEQRSILDMVDYLRRSDEFPHVLLNKLTELVKRS